jgi:hypothetical protein
MLLFRQVLGGMKKNRAGSCYTGFKPKELVFKPSYQVTVLTKKIKDTDENKDLDKLLISIREQKRYDHR